MKTLLFLLGVPALFFNDFIALLCFGFLFVWSLKANEYVCLKTSYDKAVQDCLAKRAQIIAESTTKREKELKMNFSYWPDRDPKYRDVLFFDDLIANFKFLTKIGIKEKAIKNFFLAY